jgi:hypothetical protein
MAVAVFALCGFAICRQITRAVTIAAQSDEEEPDRSSTIEE